jgi:hypothetical protein
VPERIRKDVRQLLNSCSAHRPALSHQEEEKMEAIIEGCCGLDVHQAVVVACVLIGAPGKKPRKEVRTFRTFTNDLLALRDWLKDCGCTHVAMESTGVYWKPIYAVLEDEFTMVVGNAHHISNVPGRKTDVKDAEWIADLLRHGLIWPTGVTRASLGVSRPCQLQAMGLRGFALNSPHTSEGHSKRAAATEGPRQLSSAAHARARRLPPTR